MNENTIFFSHSSKDKDLVLLIKNKLDKVTSNTLNIFMSSDGQSIPFGNNWVNKIEEALKQAKIMFVFITENSISSGWIYFEAGYAYSKSIQVIPIGIGIDISLLNAPLNLLQGFNISSEDSLNNFITIINKTFGYTFKESFNSKDYVNIIDKISINSLSTVPFEKIISEIEVNLFSNSINTDDINKRYSLEQIFDEIINYLKENNIQISKNSNNYYIVQGIKIKYQKGNNKIIKFYISPYNFKKSFDLLKTLLNFVDTLYIPTNLYLQDSYTYISSDIDISSIISNYKEFNIVEEDTRGYIYKESDVKFCIFDSLGDKPSEHISVIFNNKMEAESIIKLIYKLLDIKIINVCSSIK